MSRLLTALLSRLPAIPRLPRIVVVMAGAAFAAGLSTVLWLFSRGRVIDILQPRGDIAVAQRNLLVFAVVLAVLVLVPVYSMLFIFAWRYRDGHRRQYRPEWQSDARIESVWWGVPVLIILVLSVVTWRSSHDLDPFKPTAGTSEALQVQVIALQWKWLFIYPAQEAAAVNELVLPVGRPVEFTITSDAPMNSFWIPQLAGQVYAMSGMSTQLHLTARQVGTYRGLSSNISGAGFSDMAFTVRAVSPADFTAWAESIHHHRNAQDLTAASYAQLVRPATSGVVRYHVHDSHVYDDTVMKYMYGSDTASAASHTSADLVLQTGAGDTDYRHDTMQHMHDEGM